MQNTHSNTEQNLKPSSFCFLLSRNSYNTHLCQIHQNSPQKGPPEQDLNSDLLSEEKNTYIYTLPEYSYLNIYLNVS